MSTTVKNKNTAYYSTKMRGAQRAEMKETRLGLSKILFGSLQMN